MITETTLYRVTINGKSRWHDRMPDVEHVARIEEYITNRGGHARIDRCTTTVDREAVGTGRTIRLHDECVFEVEG